AIHAGAGPLGDGRFSPTRLNVRLVPKSSNRVWTASSSAQYNLRFGGGYWNAWSYVDQTRLKFTFTVPSTGIWEAVISGSADLWTSTPGFAQDLGIGVHGGSY